MKLFIWNRVEMLTDNWHDEGGLVVIAETLDRALEMIAKDCGKEEKPCEALAKNPDVIRECDGPELIAIHPDAGCC